MTSSPHPYVVLRGGPLSFGGEQFPVADREHVYRTADRARYVYAPSGERDGEPPGQLRHERELVRSEPLWPGHESVPHRTGRAVQQSLPFLRHRSAQGDGVIRASIIAAALVLAAAAAGCGGSAGPAAVADSPSAPASASAQPTGPPIDGGTYANTSAVMSALAAAGQACLAVADTPALSDYDGATDVVLCDGSHGASDTHIVVFKDHGAAVAFASKAVVGVPFVPGDTTALVGVDWVLTTNSSLYAQAAALALGGSLMLPQPAPSPTPAATKAPEQVTYSCTGHGAVDITYGANGSNHSASRLPFTHTDSLAAGAQYYVVSAQLQGGGSVSCTTSVQTDDYLGYAQVVSNSGSADGGYNIASAQVCSNFTGGWEKC